MSLFGHPIWNAARMWQHLEFRTLFDEGTHVHFKASWVDLCYYAGDLLS